ncbi:titin [Trichonephila inaurata madagascariensis]|uniref:Titin n=1 Tax=Trichonephila inaurata madagascariensis TaxID=2747483 RepID=A0A8X6XAD0_9ARAC|nr:titin [Trichonephila inaurata madagascariensis]
MEMKWSTVLQLVLIQCWCVLSSGSRPPAIKPFHFSDVVSEGRRTAVICVVTDGDVPFEFKWFKDGKSLKSEEGHFAIQLIDEFTSILTIKKLDSDSNGNYTCRVTNSAGSDEKSDVLVMRGKMIKTKNITYLDVPYCNC